MNSKNYRKGHKLSNINEQDRSGVCCVCGPVYIVKAAFQKGKQYYRCEHAFERKTNKAHGIRQHMLSAINSTSRTATCSKCGPRSKLYRRQNRTTGYVSWVCAMSSKEARLRVAAREKEGRPPRKTHRLSAVDSVAQTGVCSICGPIRLKARGPSRLIGRKIGPDNAAFWRCPGSLRHSHLKRYFNLSKEDYDVRHERQGGVCGICGQPEVTVIKGAEMPLMVDHCHDTGAVRGLLCAACNFGIGKFRDDPGLLEAAARYIRASRLTPDDLTIHRPDPEPQNTLVTDLDPVALAA